MPAHMNRRHLPSPVPVVLALSVAVLSGCASAGAVRNADVPDGGPNLITLAEVQAAPPGTAHTIVQSLRPRWLRARAIAISAGQLNDEVVGGRILPLVYLDDQQLGDVLSLGWIVSENLERIEFMSAVDATTRYGTGHAGGVIHVHTLRP